MTEPNQAGEDVVPMKSLFGSLPFPARWILLIAVVLVNIVVTLFLSNMPTGYTLGVATAPVVWGLVAGLVVWLIGSRRFAAFAAGFFWVTLSFASLALLRALLS